MYLSAILIKLNEFVVRQVTQFKILGLQSEIKLRNEGNISTSILLQFYFYCYYYLLLLLLKL
jgi:hypothetical protein